MAPLVSFVIALLCVGLTFSAILPSPQHVKREELGFGRNGKPLPDLFSATLVELQAGLASGSFSSVDLVTVSNCLISVRLIVGVPRENPGSQSYLACSY